MLGDAVCPTCGGPVWTQEEIDKAVREGVERAARFASFPKYSDPEEAPPMTNDAHEFAELRAFLYHPVRLPDYPTSFWRELDRLLSVYDARGQEIATLTAELAAEKARGDELHGKWRDTTSALHQFKYPPDPKMLREVADQIDCGSDCEYSSVEWDTGAHNCSQDSSKHPNNLLGCVGYVAAELRDFAKALEVRSSVPMEADG